MMISGRLRLLHPDKPGMGCCAETIYTWIYSAQARRLGLVQFLPRAHRRRGKASGRRVKGSRIALRVGVGARARAIETRSGFGHWEADTIIGAGPMKTCLHTEVERRTRFLKATLIPSKTARDTLRAQHALFSPLPQGARQSVTMDNGTEFSLHHQLLESLGILTYFADPYSSWQRGSNENRNGIIRRYLPKGTSFDSLTPQELADITDEINNRPMRILGYKTPAEAYAQETAKLNTTNHVLHF
jgi:IS30 family transposase